MIHCLIFLRLFAGILCLVLVLICITSSLAINLTIKRELVALISLSPDIL